MNTITQALELARLLEPTWPAITAGITRSGHPTCLQSEGEKHLATQLKDVEEKLSTLRDERREVVYARDESRDTWARTGADISDNSSPAFKAVEQLTARLGSIDEQIDKTKQRQVALLRLMGQGGAPAPGVEGMAGPPQPSLRGWDARGLLASDVARTQLKDMAGASRPRGTVALGEVIDRESLAAAFQTPMAADLGDTPDMRRAPYLGVVPQLRRRLRVLDLLPVGTMDQKVLPYTQESGSFDTAAETAEGDVKPEAGVTYTDQDATARTIAHWLKIRKQAIADYPALQAQIDTRLRYGVLRRLEDQVLGGDGTGENIEGILNTTGIGAVTWPGGATYVTDQILSGITAVFLADAEASGVIMHPTDWKAALIAKAAGSGEYLSGGPFGTTAESLWGVPLIPSKAIAQGTALVGDFAVGAQLFFREGVSVLISDSDQDDFLRNKVTLLAEMRAALAVFRPAAFTEVALA